MQIAIAKWGNSAAIRIPSKVLTQISAQIGNNLEVKVEGNKIILEPVNATLEDLLAQITIDNRHAELIEGKTGNELL
jgi:antitoxin MazE